MRLRETMSRALGRTNWPLPDISGDPFIGQPTSGGQQARNRGSRSQKGKNMRKYLLVTTVVAALATPAFAGAPGPYVGIEGGVTFPQSSDLDIILNNTSATPPTTATYS